MTARNRVDDSQPEKVSKVEQMTYFDLVGMHECATVSSRSCLEHEYGEEAGIITQLMETLAQPCTGNS